MNAVASDKAYIDYLFRNGAQVKNLTPKVVNDELEKIHKEYGKIDAATVVDLARSKNHPLHDGFEWEDSIAAEEHRKHQARVMIGAVIKVTRTDPEPLRFTKPYINVRRGEERTYLSTAKVLQIKN